MLDYEASGIIFVPKSINDFFKPVNAGISRDRIHRVPWKFVHHHLESERLHISAEIVLTKRESPGTFLQASSCL